MNNRDMALINDLTSRFMDYMKLNHVNEYGMMSTLSRKLSDSICDALLKEQGTLVDEIRAQNAVIEVINQKNGQLYRRYVEIQYSENDNGLRLSGEAMDGSPADIVFLSEQAIAKINELKGQGPDAPRCGH